MKRNYILWVKGQLHFYMPQLSSDSGEGHLGSPFSRNLLWSPWFCASLARPCAERDVRVSLVTAGLLPAVHRPRGAGRQLLQLSQSARQDAAVRQRPPSDGRLGDPDRPQAQAGQKRCELHPDRGGQDPGPGRDCLRRHVRQHRWVPGLGHNLVSPAALCPVEPAPPRCPGQCAPLRRLHPWLHVRDLRPPGLW